MAEPLRKESLRVDLASAREALSAHRLGLRRSLDVVDNVKRGVRHHPAAWFGAAAIVGLLLSRIPAGRKKVELKEALPRSKKSKDNTSGAGKALFASTLLKVGADLAKPALLRWARERMTNTNVRRERNYR
jgi:hypothetical protein